MLSHTKQARKLFPADVLYDRPVLARIGRYTLDPPGTDVGHSARGAANSIHEVNPTDTPLSVRLEP